MAKKGTEKRSGSKKLIKNIKQILKRQTRPNNI